MFLHVARPAQPEEATFIPEIGAAQGLSGSPASGSPSTLAVIALALATGDLPLMYVGLLPIYGAWLYRA